MRVFLSLYWCFCSAFCLAQTLQKADSLFQQEAYGKAIVLYQETLNNTKNLTDSLLAKLHHKLGVSQYYLLEDQAAIQSWKNSLAIRKTILPKSDIDILKNYRNLGNAYVNIHQLDFAKKQFEIALQLNEKDNQVDSILLCETYRELGYILSQQNDLINAVSYLKVAVDLGQKIYKDEPWRIADIYNLLVLVYLEYKQPQEMILYAEKGVAIYENLNDKYEEDYISLSHFYNNLGIANDYIGDFKKSIQFYKKALIINQQFPETRKIYVAKNFNNLAALELKIRQVENALQNNEKAIALNLEQNNSGELAINYNTKGNIYLFKKEYEESLANYQKGITYLIADFKPKNIHELPPIQNSVIVNKPFLIQDLFDKAKAYQAIAKETNPIQNLKYSLQTIDSISVLINLVRNSFESDASKQFLTTQAKSIFEKAITICYELAQLTEEKDLYFTKALDYAERSKSIILLEAVKQSGAKTMAGIPSNLLKREQVLKKEIANIESEIFAAEEVNSLATLRINLSQQQQQLAALVDTFETQNPTYFQLKYDFQTFDLKAVRQKLEATEGIIEYFIGKEKAYWFYLDKAQIKMGAIANVATIANQIKDFRNSIIQPFLAQTIAKDSFDVAYTNSGKALYQQLLAPSLQNSAIQQIRIIPDGVLGYLPFDALLTAAVSKQQMGNYKSYPFLQKTHRLCYSYSLTLLEERQQQNNQVAKKEILAFAPIFQAKHPIQLGKTTIQLSPLLANVGTTEQLLQAYQGKAYLKVLAKKESFIAESSKYAYLHLASHAQMNDENADYSFISFAQTDDTVRQDNLLFVRELYNVPLKAEMVVLSACETALGEIQEGEGIISLARAFAYAGAKSIITTLWQVSDQKSAELVTAFYQFLAEGNTKDRALWKAKNTLIEQGFNAHPYHWAGFIPIGDMRAIELKKRSDWMVWGLGGIGLLVLLMGSHFLTRKDTV